MAFDEEYAFSVAKRIAEKHPGFVTGVGPPYRFGPTVEVRIPLGMEIPYLPNSWAHCELHVVAETEGQREAILAKSGHLGPHVVVGDAPHVSPLFGMAPCVASSPRPRADNIRRMAVRIAQDEYLYHVTWYEDLGSIDEDGPSPGGGGSLGKGGYSGHSSGRLFMTDRGGLFFWFGRMEEHASNDSDDPLDTGHVPVVLRFPEPDDAELDEAGTSDARSDAFYAEVGVDPDEIEVWDGSSRVPLEDWDSIDPSSSFDVDEGEEWHVFKDIRQNPLYPG